MVKLYLGLKGLIEKACGNANILGLMIRNTNICRSFFGV